MYQKLESRKEKWLVWDYLVKLQMRLKPAYSGWLSTLDITGIDFRLSLEWAMVANSGVLPNWQQLETMTIWVNASQAGFRTASRYHSTIFPLCCSACTILYYYTRLCYKVQLHFMGTTKVDWLSLGRMPVVSVSSGRFPLFHTLLPSTMLWCSKKDLTRCGSLTLDLQLPKSLSLLSFASNGSW